MWQGGGGKIRRKGPRRSLVQPPAQSMASSETRVVAVPAQLGSKHNFLIDHIPIKSPSDSLEKKKNRGSINTSLGCSKASCEGFHTQRVPLPSHVCKSHFSTLLKLHLFLQLLLHRVLLLFCRRQDPLYTCISCASSIPVATDTAACFRLSFLTSPSPFSLSHFHLFH